MVSYIHANTQWKTSPRWEWMDQRDPDERVSAMNRIVSSPATSLWDGAGIALGHSQCRGGECCSVGGGGPQGRSGDLGDGLTCGKHCVVFRFLFVCSRRGQVRFGPLYLPLARATGSNVQRSVGARELAVPCVVEAGKAGLLLWSAILVAYTCVTFLAQWN